MNVFENDVVEFDDRRWLFPVAGSGFCGFRGEVQLYGCFVHVVCLYFIHKS